ncbi:spondin domain-containing protein [Pseudocolwellia agarivorans]|uniref:spondin domain-containing protein n=1 Tax=Pseudocolwellia agarivorans TaxID=1911682 RepID=UPI0009866D0B|nr:spondin domain-containing protein [Pseudocolwellia agarivorans]
MISSNTYKKASLSAAIALSLFVSACGSDNDNKTATPEPVEPPVVPTPVNYEYMVKVVNLTTAQPMSPVAVVLHNEGKLWEIGMPASTALENLAESGDNSAVLSETMVLSGQSGASPLPPGMSETITVSIEDTMPSSISIATMLVNTNDAFTGVTAKDISNLAVNESISLLTSSYDSGTEKNSELMATIPGPAAGGEGYNEMRDDVDYVAMHPGVVTKDDGLAQSVLTQDHRFDNPTLSITITRVE